MIAAELGYRLAGVTDGEGHFGIRTSRRGYSCYFVVKLRADDLILLERLREGTGLGTISWIRVKQTPGRANNPAVMWRVQTKAECLELVSIFEEYPLWSSKAEEFPIWADAVRYWHNPIWTEGRNSRGHYEQLIDWTPMELANERLRAIRAYVTPLELREAVPV